MIVEKCEPVGTCLPPLCRVFPTRKRPHTPFTKVAIQGKQGSSNMNLITTASPSRRLAWTVATVLALAGIVGLALAPRVAAAIPKTAIQMVYAWLCASLVGSAYVVVTLANDAEGASEDSEDF